MPEAILAGRTVIEIEGPEAEKFLQNVITTDLDELGEGVAMSGALLTPQGKILADFLISRAGDGAFRLETNSALADDLARRLTLYKLRAKAEIRQAEESLVAISWGDDSSSSMNESTVRDGRFPAGQRVLRHYGKFDVAKHGQDEWEAFRIAQGIAECGADYEPASAFPHDVLMDKNGGVSFRKGCFVGQEVVSRMQHRGTARRRIMVAETDGSMPPSGTELAAGGKTIGQLLSVRGGAGLALVRADRVGEATSQNIEFLADGTTVELHFPEWAKITLPNASEGEEA